MAIDPQAQRILDLLVARGGPALTSLPLPQVRAQEVIGPQRGPDMETQDVLVPGPGGQLLLRFYYPQSGELPALVYFHKGGFALGSVAAADDECRVLAQKSGCCVVSVAYRLAPEHKFPAAVLDAYTALSYVHENAGDHHIDYMRIAIGGSSAGANLATVAARQAKERRGPTLSFQLLFYPVTDLRTFDTPSYREFAEGPVVTREEMAFFRDRYLPDEASRSDPAASPLSATNLIGMPPAYVVTAELDALRDDGEMYAEALTRAGTQVTLRRVPGVFHGFLSYFYAIDVANEVFDEAAALLRQRFSVAG